MTTPTPMTAERLAVLLDSAMATYIASMTTEDWLGLAEAHPAAIVREMGTKILMQERDLAAREAELAAMKAENSKLRSALEIVHFKREPWQ